MRLRSLRRLSWNLEGRLYLHLQRQLKRKGLPYDQSIDDYESPALRPQESK